MNLSEQITSQLKDAMRAKDQAKLRALRAIKAELLLLNTKEGGTAPTQADELAVLVKMAKQRKDSIAIYIEQNRPDLAKVEQEELETISTFLPAQLSEDELKNEISAIIRSLGASGMKDMGKVMSVASGNLKGKADGKAISQVVKALLS